MSTKRVIGLGVTLMATGLAACSGVADCKDDGEACATMLNANGVTCAEAFQLKHSERKRKYCEHAIDVVGDQAVASAVPGLSAVLTAPHTNVPDDNHVQAAAKALGKIGDASAVSALAAAVDYEAGTSSDPRDKMANRANEEIAAALGKIGSEQGVEALLKMLDESRDNHVILKAVRSLGQIGAKEAVEPIEKIALEHNNKFMRKNAVVALGNIGDPAATDTLIKMMFIEYQGVSFYREASFALFQLGPSTTDALLKTMALENAEVNAIFEKTGGLKESAIKAKCGFVLADLRDERAIEPLISAFKGAVEKLDPVVLGYTAPPLGALKAAAAVPILAEQMKTIDQSLRDPMMRALVMIGDRKPVPEMIQLMTRADFIKKCTDMGNSEEACTAEKEAFRGALESAADHASNLAGPEHLQLFEGVASGAEDEKLKTYFMKRLARVKVAAECKDDSACWAKKLTDDDDLIREKAAWELKRLLDPRTAGDLAKALADKDRETRYAAIYAYWDFGGPEAIETIEKVLEDEEGSADYVRVNEDLKRLHVHLLRMRDGGGES
jgi:HEAT repeat protein